MVVDEATYAHLFDDQQVFNQFAKTREEKTVSGAKVWTGKYILGQRNYLEIFTPGALAGTTFGSVGLGFITTKQGIIDSVRHYWAATQDSVHVERAMTTEDGKTWPWFTSVSIPRSDSLALRAWVMENSAEELAYAGFNQQELRQPIEYAEYMKRLQAKMRHVPLDSVRFDRLFDKVSSLSLSIPFQEYAYLRRTLLDIGFVEKTHLFEKGDFVIRYSINDSADFLLKKIGFSLRKKVAKQKWSSGKIALILKKYKAEMVFSYK